MVKLSEIFLGGTMLEVNLVFWFKDMSWTKISSIDMGEGWCYWWNVAKHRVIELLKSSLFSLCKFLWLVDLQESVFVKKGLGLDQNSGLISVNAAWNLSREHWWDLVNFEFIFFSSSLTVCLSKTVKYLVCLSV